MISKLSFIVAVGFAIYSCGSRESTSEERDGIEGVYVREYTFTVIDPETGSKIGMGSIKDTISIRSAVDGYQIANRKWRLNDYDKEGWQNMEHADDRPFRTFQANFNPKDGSFASQSMISLSLDLGKRQLFKDRSRDKPYRKLNK